MKRFMFRTQLRNGHEEAGLLRLAELQEDARELVRDGAIMTIGCYKWMRNLFLYYECIGRDIAPEDMFGGLQEHLEDWPGTQQMRKWILMTDVFHFNEPASYDHWLRKESVERRVGRVAHLKPEMISSYIYYHYQLQEERAFLGDKYEIIAIHENLLFGYQEFPKVIEDPVLPKKLSTSGTPVNWNDSRMDLHFQPWEDGHLYFKPIDEVFTIYCGDEALKKK
ncbi:hypothetical protein [Paenibacillus radicis (ex Xue et al. 2023)]|uniref:Uncharacterized protein n=1 Tax=Paenibacillus radicis (ex Xue et al. 2023) TaxID=2972489 RepID=A0ABT1YKM1_9BACL|nr:hypothetical protein [Paenibacillus radicis (ex Xue et al. 2023)]MCR8633742.1 hypothetical protein [Paenibacillus radicis (ex Xue et al. 2023)]